METPPVVFSSLSFLEFFAAFKGVVYKNIVGYVGVNDVGVH